MDKRNEPLAQEAATEWFVRLRDEKLTDADRAAFETWLDADPSHVKAYQQMEQLWSGLDQINRPATQPRHTRNERVLSGKASTLRRVAIAASVAIVVGLSGYIATNQGFFADYRTGIGERRTVSLKDGSTVQLNTATALSLDFSQTQRRITLHSGEAHFVVSSDVNRPFIVATGIGEIQALGTAFSVKHREDRVEVIVTRSRVQVSVPAQQAVVVDAGQEIDIKEEGLGTVATANVRRDLAWRRGLLIFDNQPLSEVLAELDRFRHGRTVIMDESLNAFPVTGSFSIDKIDSALETIEQALPVRLHKLTDLLILVFHDPST